MSGDSLEELEIIRNIILSLTFADKTSLTPVASELPMPHIATAQENSTVVPNHGVKRENVGSLPIADRSRAVVFENIEKLVSFRIIRLSTN